MYSPEPQSGASLGENSCRPDDLAAVHGLLAKYGILLDQECDTQWSELFTPHARLEIIGGATVKGREALQAFARTSPRGTHVTGVPHIEAADSQHLRYRATSSWIFLNRKTGSSVGGLYHDELVPHGDGALLFASRRIAMWTR
jgi:hypothetical protein